MKSVLLAPLLLALALPAQAQTRSYTVSGFDTLRVEGAVDVVVEDDVPPYARAEGSSKEIDKVEVRLNGRTLTVSVNRSAWGASANDRVQPALVRVGTPTLEKISINGPGRATLGAVEGDEFALTIAGTGTADISGIDVDKFVLRMAGAGSVRLAGEAVEGAMLVRGLGAVQASGLAFKELNLAIEGTSLVQVNVTDLLDLEATGPADIGVAGGPECELDIRGPARLSGCD